MSTPAVQSQAPRWLGGLRIRTSCHGWAKMRNTSHGGNALPQVQPTAKLGGLSSELSGGYSPGMAWPIAQPPHCQGAAPQSARSSQPPNCAPSCLLPGTGPQQAIPPTACSKQVKFSTKPHAPQDKPMWPVLRLDGLGLPQIPWSPGLLRALCAAAVLGPPVPVKPATLGPACSRTPAGGSGACERPHVHRLWNAHATKLQARAELSPRRCYASAGCVSVPASAPPAPSPLSTPPTTPKPLCEG